MTSEDEVAVLPTTDSAALTDALHDGVLGVDGVVRVVPPLTAALRGLRQGTSGPGLTVRVTGTVVDVTVDLVTADSTAARAAGQAVLGELRRVIVEHGLQPGLLTVGVLDIEASAG